MSDTLEKCAYCGAARPSSEMISHKLFYRKQGWTPSRFGKSKWGQVLASDVRRYCHDKGCAGFDQMAHEG